MATLSASSGPNALNRACNPMHLLFLHSIETTAMHRLANPLRSDPSSYNPLRTGKCTGSPCGPIAQKHDSYKTIKNLAHLLLQPVSRRRRRRCCCVVESIRSRWTIRRTSFACVISIQSLPVAEQSTATATERTHKYTLKSIFLFSLELTCATSEPETT